MRRARDCHLGLAIEHINERVERRRVLAQALPGIERKNRHRTARFPHELFTDNSTFMVPHDVQQLELATIKHIVIGHFASPKTLLRKE